MRAVHLKVNNPHVSTLVRTSVLHGPFAAPITVWTHYLATEVLPWTTTWAVDRVVGAGGQGRAWQPWSVGRASSLSLPRTSTFDPDGGQAVPRGRQIPPSPSSSLMFAHYGGSTGRGGWRRLVGVGAPSLSPPLPRPPSLSRLPPTAGRRVVGAGTLSVVG